MSSDKNAFSDNQHNSYPSIGIIVPIYGVDLYLDECIKSIVSQTYTNIEIILVDDGSTGQEPEICDFYSQNDSRIKVIHKKNGGSVAARLTGLENTVSPYVTFVDGDDYISSDYVEKLMEHVIQDKPDMVTACYTRVTDGEKQEENQNIHSGLYENSDFIWLLQNMNCLNKQYYINGIFSTVCLKVFKTDKLLEIAKNTPSSIRMGDDAAFAFPYLLNCHKVAVDNSIHGYYYRSVPNSQSRYVDSGIFTASSALYEYLKPFYHKTNDPEIITQLDLYRLFLIMVPFFSGLDNSGLISNHHYCKVIKRSSSSLGLFKDLGNLLSLNAPRFEITAIRLIMKRRWMLLELCCDYKYIQNIFRKVLRK